MATPTWITPQSLTLPTTFNVWTPTSLSAYIPSTATGVMLLFQGATVTAGSYFAARMTGSGDTYSGGVAYAIGTQGHLWSGCSGTQSIDILLGGSGAANGAALWLIGYTGPEATYTANALLLGTVSTSAYTTFNLSTTGAAGASAAIVTFGTNPGPCGLRQLGSTDDYLASNTPGTGVGPLGGYLVGIGTGANANQIAAKASNSCSLYLMGWMNGVVWNTNAIVRTPGTTGSLQALTTEPNGIGYLYQMKATAAYDWTIANTSGSTLPNSIGGKGSTAVMSTGATPYANISNTAQGVLELGYFLQIAQGPNTPIGRCIYTLP